MTLSPTIVRQYDIRGTYLKNLFEKDAYFLGQSFGSWMKDAQKKTVVVGCDGRYSSPILKEKLIQGLMNVGAHVIDIDAVPTPFVYYAVQTRPADAGIMVTGSHNPKDDNGFKITLKERPFFGKDLEALQHQNIHTCEGGTLCTYDVVTPYIEMIKNMFKAPLNYRIVFDTGNGIVGPFIKKIAPIMVTDPHFLYTDVDGNFPNHAPDPSDQDAMVDLQKEVMSIQADLGIAFDGDGDRFGVVTGHGDLLGGDELGCLLAYSLLTSIPSPTCLFDIKTSSSILNALKHHGAKIMLSPSGHSLIKEKMKQMNADFAGEVSGHFFFKSHFSFDDGVYAACHFLKHCYPINITIPKAFSTPEIRIPYPEEDKFHIIERIKSRLSEGQFISIDGIRFESDTGWWLIRASHTQAALSLRFEGCSSHFLTKIIADFLELVKNEIELLNILQEICPQFFNHI
jgi:phosphomannomutase